MRSLFQTRPLTSHIVESHYTNVSNRTTTPTQKVQAPPEQDDRGRESRPRTSKTTEAEHDNRGRARRPKTSTTTEEARRLRQLKTSATSEEEPKRARRTRTSTTSQDEHRRTRTSQTTEEELDMQDLFLPHRGQGQTTHAPTRMTPTPTQQTD